MGTVKFMADPSAVNTIRNCTNHATTWPAYPPTRSASTGRRVRHLGDTVYGYLHDPDLTHGPDAPGGRVS